MYFCSVNCFCILFYSKEIKKRTTMNTNKKTYITPAVKEYEMGTLSVFAGSIVTATEMNRIRQNTFDKTDFWNNNGN